MSTKLNPPQNGLTHSNNSCNPNTLKTGPEFNTHLKGPKAGLTSILLQTTIQCRIVHSIGTRNNWGSRGHLYIFVPVGSLPQCKNRVFPVGFDGCDWQTTIGTNSEYIQRQINKHLSRFQCQEHLQSKQFIQKSQEQQFYPWWTKRCLQLWVIGLANRNLVEFLALAVITVQSMREKASYTGWFSGYK